MSDGKKSPVLRLVLLGAGLGVLLKLFVVDFLTVSGTSMEPSVRDGSVVVVFKLAYGMARPFGGELLFQWAAPERGDIVLYFYNDRAVIKRCVSVGGDPLEFSASSGYSLYADGNWMPLSEPQYQRIKHSARVPEGMVLAVGDNYADSVDSRDYGFVPERNILGKVLFR